MHFSRKENRDRIRLETTKFRYFLNQIYLCSHFSILLDSIVMIPRNGLQRYFKKKSYSKIVNSQRINSFIKKQSYLQRI